VNTLPKIYHISLKEISVHTSNVPVNIQHITVCEYICINNVSQKRRLLLNDADDTRLTFPL